MDTLARIAGVLARSSDRHNPSPEELYELFDRIRPIAVVGMSRDPAKSARRVPAYLAAQGYDVIPVNPNARRMLGRDAVASLADIAEPVDVVLIFRPGDEAGKFVDQAAARTERPAIWLQEGIRADEAVARARAAGLLVVQDLCAYEVHRALTF